MRLGFLAAAAASALIAWSCCAAGARAARVIVLAADGHARIAQDRFLPGTTLSALSTPTPQLTPTPLLTLTAPATQRSRAPSPALAHAANASTSSPTMVSALQLLRRTGAITSPEFQQYMGDWTAALATVKRLPAARAAELEAVIENLHGIAASGQLEVSRLPALFLTLENNVQWWTQGPWLSYGQRVEFSGSQLVWEYYPGQGIELQMLANFGKANGLYDGGPSDYPELSELISELIPLAADRAGGVSWEYYFEFDGGVPPWTSAMTQGTAIEALTRAYEASKNPTYLQLAAQALPVLIAPPPGGVSIPTYLGRRFLQYSFAPSVDIINAFLQTLIGLYEFAHVSGNPEASQLFAAGTTEAQAELPEFNTGAWSLYQPGLEDDLSYHDLVTGFLQQLCQLTATPIYCSTAAAFQTDLTTPPTLAQLTTTAAAGKPFTLRFRLSKVSHVGIVLTHGAQTVLATSADFPYGVSAFAVPALKRAGEYSVGLAATDLAGNFNRIVGTLEVTAPAPATTQGSKPKRELGRRS